MPRGVKRKITEEKGKEAEAGSSSAVTKNGIRSDTKVNKGKGDRASKSNRKEKEENVEVIENLELTPKNSQVVESGYRGCRDETGNKARRNISATFQEEDNEVTMNVDAEDMAFLGNSEYDEDQ